MNPSILGIADGFYPFVFGLGGSEGQITISQVVDEVIAAMPSPIVGNFVISGGSVVWTSGLSFTVTACIYYINNVRYTSVQQNITLNAADGANPRIDIIGLDNTSTVFKVTGTAAASPSEPNYDPSTQIQLAFVTIATGATTPTNSAQVTLYTEAAGDPGEWNVTEVGTGFTTDSASSPITGTKSILCASSVNADYLQLAKGSGSIDINNYGYLIFKIKNTSTWGNNRSLLVEFLSSGVLKGRVLQVINGSYGFSGSSTAVQLLALPTVLFGIAAGTTVNQLRFITNGSSINFRLDDVYLHISGSVMPSQPNALSQDQADARYITKLQAVNAIDATSATEIKASVTETTATGTVTLTATSDMYQFIAPNGSNRNVQLPAESLGRTYFIVHTDGANTLTILNDAAATEATLATGECVTLISGASVWRAIKGTIE